MFGFWMRFFSSMRFMTRVADEIGVNKKVFQTALTEVGVNFATYEQFFKTADQDIDEHTRLQRICMVLIPKARMGAARLRMRFGDQPALDQLVEGMSDYEDANLDILEDMVASYENSSS